MWKLKVKYEEMDIYVSSHDAGGIGLPSGHDFELMLIVFLNEMPSFSLSIAMKSKLKR